MKVIKIGIAPQEKIRERVLAIAKGEIKPKASDPKIWFTSMRSLSQVLSDENRAHRAFVLFHLHQPIPRHSFQGARQITLLTPGDVRQLTD